MGKQKRRVLHKNKINSTLFMTRDEAVNRVFGILKNPKRIERQKAHEIISLFGLDAEELSEAGVDYESLKSFEGII